MADGHEDFLSSPLPAPLTEEESWIRDVEQNATDHTATLADISYPKPRWCGPGLAAGLEAMGTSSVLAGCPVAHWLMGCNLIIFSLDISSFSLANSQFPRTPVLLPQSLCWGSVGYGRPSLASRGLSTQWNCFVLSPNHFPVPGIRIHTLLKPRSLLLERGRPFCQCVTCWFCWGVHISDVMGNKEDFAWQGRGFPPNCCFRCPSAARPRVPASSPIGGGVAAPLPG